MEVTLFHLVFGADSEYYIVSEQHPNSSD